MDARESVVEMSDEQQNELTCDGARVGRWFFDIESRKAAYAQGKQARTAE